MQRSSPKVCTNFKVIPLECFLAVGKSDGMIRFALIAASIGARRISVEEVYELPNGVRFAVNEDTTEDDFNRLARHAHNISTRLVPSQNADTSEGGQTKTPAGSYL